MRRFVSIFGSLFIAVFAADALLSVVNDCLVLFAGIQSLAVFREMIGLLALAMACAVYLLIGITPLAPKRFLLPLALFLPLAMLALIPVYLFQRELFEEISLGLSAVQLILAAIVYFSATKDLPSKWPIIPEDKLGERKFSWLNSFGFVFGNLFLLAPSLLAYTAFCISTGITRASEGFVSVDLKGVWVEARTYSNSKSDKVLLVPMMHVGDKEFYDSVSKSFPSNSLVLTEGVTDHEELMPQKLTYEKMAQSLGLTEQKDNFIPAETTRELHADVDISDFSKSTIDILKTVTLIHTKGFTAETMDALMKTSQSADAEKALWDDLLRKRNDNVLSIIESELPTEDFIVVPWGAAHMPGLSNGLIADGFKATESKKHRVISFGFSL